MPFIEKTKTKERKIRLPKFQLDDVEDYYTYYVLILEIPEDIFWFADYSFLLGVVSNKTSYDAWLNSEIEKERKRARKG